MVPSMLPANQHQQQQPNTSTVLEPTAYDILLGRHKHCFHHVGNQAFRNLITKFMNHYASLTNKREKINLVSLILNIIHNGGGRFLRESGSYYVQVKGRTAREKISHALRDHCNRVMFRNANNDTTMTTTSDGSTSNETSNEINELSRACWRTLVFETVQSNQKGKKSTKKTVREAQGETSRHKHLDTKNHSLFLNNTRQQITNLQQASSVASAAVDTTRRPADGHASMPMPHYLSTGMVPSPSLQAAYAHPLPNKSTMNFPGNVRHADSRMFMSDARKQIEKQIVPTPSSTTLARSNQGHAMPPLPHPLEHAHQSMAASTHPSFNIPRKPRLVAAARDLDEPSRNDGTTLAAMPDANWNTSTTALLSSDHFVGQQNNVLLADNMRLDDGAIPEQSTNEAVGNANIFEEEEQSIDPIPLHPLPIQPVPLHPAQVFPTHHHMDTHGEPAARQDEAARNEESRSADQQIDSMLLDLFRR